MLKSLRYVLVFAAAASMAAFPATILFGGNGGHPNPDGSPLSINNGWLVTVDQSSGAVTPVGHPSGVSKLSGLAFELNGALYGSTVNGNNGFPPPLSAAPTSDLVQINPATGSLIADIGPITAGGHALQIADLAVQPGTGVLFGISASSAGDPSAAGNLYIIDTKTGAATLVGATGDFFGSIGFAPDGTLYMSSADLDAMGNLFNSELKTLNPANAKTSAMVPTPTFYSALAVRPTDGVIFGGNGDAGGIFTIDPKTGAQTTVGNTGLNFVGDLAFQPIPEPGPCAMLGFGFLGLWLIRLRSR